MTYLTVQTVADQLTVKQQAILDWIRTGQLVAVNVGRGTERPRWRIASTDLDAFLAGRRATPAVKPDRRRRAKLQADVIKFF
ncbi:MAG: DNA-binding protein [Gemmataceae bacterium]|nr:DNA-binding protein [Gemmataceae bacterium]